MKLLSKSQYREISEINITPFVDVLLILLVIFILTAPVITKDIKISLPEEKLNNVVNSIKREFVVDLDSKNRIYYSGKRKNLVSLGGELKIFLSKGGKEVFIRADRNLKYENVISLIAFIQKQGFTDIGLLIQEK